MSDAYKKQAGGNHYKGFAIQPGEYCHKNKLGNYESYAIKYITRYNTKWRDDLPKQLEDLDKAIHCLELLKTELTQQPKDYNETPSITPTFTNTPIDLRKFGKTPDENSKKSNPFDGSKPSKFYREAREVTPQRCFDY